MPVARPWVLGRWHKRDKRRPFSGTLRGRRSISSPLHEPRCLGRWPRVHHQILHSEKRVRVEIMQLGVLRLHVDQLRHNLLSLLHACVVKKRDAYCIEEILIFRVGFQNLLIMLENHIRLVGSQEGLAFERSSIESSLLDGDA